MRDMITCCRVSGVDGRIAGRHSSPPYQQLDRGGQRRGQKTFTRRFEYLFAQYQSIYIIAIIVLLYIR